MKIIIYYDGRRTESISAPLQLALEEKVEMQLIEALSPFESELQHCDYTIRISFSADYNSIVILMDGLSDDLTKRTEEAVAKVFSNRQILEDIVQPEHMSNY